jgi:hypothetical protein
MISRVKSVTGEQQRRDFAGFIEGRRTPTVPLGRVSASPVVRLRSRSAAAVARLQPGLHVASCLNDDAAPLARAARRICA